MGFVGVIVAIVGLGFLILAHEFGHFIVAKATGMRVEEFSLGFGPYLISRRIGETVYGISAIPLGGYVRVTGMHKEEFEAWVAEAEAEKKGELSRASYRMARDPEDRLAGRRVLSAQEIASTPLERRYYAHPFWHKFLFIIAGVVMNVVVAFFLVWVVGVQQGETVTTTSISAVAPGTPASLAGLEAGDRIVAINGRPVSDWQDVRTQVLTKPGETITITVERAGETKQISVLLAEREDGTGYLGVEPAVKQKDLGPAAALAYAGRVTGSMALLVFKGLWMMLSGEVPVLGSQGLAGPVGIIQLSTEAFVGGYYLMLLALISVNLAILNMLPLLPLDGGHVLLSIVERVRGRAIPLRVFERISMVGIGLFVALFLLATSNDLGRLFGGW